MLLPGVTASIRALSRQHGTAVWGSTKDMADCTQNRAGCGPVPHYCPRIPCDCRVLLSPHDVGRCVSEVPFADDMITESSRKRGGKSSTNPKLLPSWRGICYLRKPRCISKIDLGWLDAVGAQTASDLPAILRSMQVSLSSERRRARWFGRRRGSYCLLSCSSFRRTCEPSLLVGKYLYGGARKREAAREGEAAERKKVDELFRCEFAACHVRWRRPAWPSDRRQTPCFLFSLGGGQLEEGHAPRCGRGNSSTQTAR